MIQNVEELGSELYVEALRNPPDPVVLEKREIQVRQGWPDQGISAGIAGQIEACRERKTLLSPHLLAVCVVESQIWRRGECEALGLYIIEAPGVDRGRASGAGQAIWEVYGFPTL